MVKAKGRQHSTPAIDSIGADHAEEEQMLAGGYVDIENHHITTKGDVSTEDEVDYIEGNNNTANQTSVSSTTYRVIKLAIDGYHERIYLNGDPEYHLSFSMVASYLLLFQFKHHLVVVFRRLCTQLLAWVVTGLLFFMTFTYNDSIFENPFLAPEKHMFVHILRGMFQSDYDNLSQNLPSRFLQHSLATLSTTGPLILLTLSNILLYFVLIKPSDICEVLYHDHRKDDVMKPKSMSKDEKYHVKETVPYSRRLYLQMVGNLTDIVTTKFWKFWCNDILCKWSPSLQFSREDENISNVKEAVSKSAVLLQVLFLLVRLPVALLMVPLYSLPISSVLHGIILSPQKSLVPWCCLGKVKLSRLIVLITVPTTMIGIALVYWMMFNLVILLSHSVVFYFIDILRHSTSTMPGFVFIISLLLYIKRAFVDFEEGYRHLKTSMFDICETLNGEAADKCLRIVLSNNPRAQLWHIDERGEVSIPKYVFQRLCKVFRPYRTQLTRTCITLFSSLGLVVFLFTVITEFEVYQDFSETGETLLMIMTVSIPGLLGNLTSSVELSLQQAELQHRIRVYICSMVNYVPVPEKGPEKQSDVGESLGTTLTVNQYNLIQESRL